MRQKIIVTGSAGFIGFHLCKNLLNEGVQVLGIDNMNDYYEISLKKARLSAVEKISKNNWDFREEDIKNKESLSSIFKEFKPEIVINLAAQAGVRYSLENPSEYIQSNLVGFGNILECCRENNIRHLIYASSSSVYGGNRKLPFSEYDSINHPVSLYAATKRSNELMAHTYSHLYNLSTTGLRFFTVYGPWGRPDMSYYIFTSKILNNEPIKVFNNGEMMRDFTYIDDVIDSIVKLINKPPSKNNKFEGNSNLGFESWAPFKIFNIGNSSPINLIEFINIIEEYLGLKAKKEFLPMQLGDLKATSAEINLLNNWVGFKPKTSIKEGLKNFIDWYINYYEKSY